MSFEPKFSSFGKTSPNPRNDQPSMDSSPAPALGNEKPDELMEEINTQLSTRSSPCPSPSPQQANLPQEDLSSFMSIPIHQFLPSGFNAMQMMKSEGSMEEQDDGDDFQLPEVLKTQPEEVAFASASFTPVGRSTWYPHRHSDDARGMATRAFISVMEEIAEATDQSAETLFQGKVFLRDMNCRQTARVWVSVERILPFVRKFNMHGITADIASMFAYSPEKLQTYLKGVSRCLPHCTSTVLAMETLESRLTSLTNEVISMTDTVRLHQEETVKFSDHLSNVSKSVANLQSTMEESVIKATKLDLLPRAQESSLAKYSLPSTSSGPPKNKVKTLTFSSDGEYSGIYNLKIIGGKIISIEPPATCPEFGYMCDLPSPAREIFFNLDQCYLSNKLSSNPELRQRITAEKTPDRRAAVLEWTKGVKTVDYQWSRHLNYGDGPYSFSK